MLVQPGMKIVAGKFAKRVGTIGFIAKRKLSEDSSLYLSCAFHVLNESSNPSVKIYSEDDQLIAIHYYEDFGKLRRVDLAFARLENNVQASNLIIGTALTLKNPVTPKNGDQVRKIGTKTGDTTGRVIAVGEEIYREKYAIMIQTPKSSMPDHGDSGATWFIDPTGEAVASHVRPDPGDEKSEYFVGTHLNIVLKILGLELI